jgi:hypothetical protein
MNSLLAKNAEVLVTMDKNRRELKNDHSYIFKNGNNVDCQVEAAKEIGVRFHASRGSMSLGESKSGLPPDDCVEEEDFILLATVASFLPERIA